MAISHASSSVHVIMESCGRDGEEGKGEVVKMENEMRERQIGRGEEDGRGEEGGREKRMGERRGWVREEDGRGEEDG